MEKQSVHFIGIGGIGMSSLAQFFLSRGFSVSGSDIEASETTDVLLRMGAHIAIGPHLAKNIPRNTGRVIVSSTIPKENPELRAARKRKLKVQTYADAVGGLTKKYQTIAVSGAHGKSTTTALAALMMEKANLDPTVIIGTKLHEWDGKNFRLGNSMYLLLEADEHNGAFLNYNPTIAISTNIDAEHLDHYKTIEGVHAAFKKFLSGVPKNGVLILNKDDPRLLEIGTALKKKGKNVKWFSTDHAAADFVSKNLTIPGKHNVSNALAALALAKELKVPGETALDVIRSYKGSWRRADYKGLIAGAKVFDDYAHHPTEIKATLAGFREKYPMSRIWCIFQPHHHQRLQLLFEDFIGAFKNADRVVLLDVYQVAGREKKGQDPDAKTSFDLARALDTVGRKTVFYLTHAGELPRILQENVFENDIVLMMGAGDINRLTPRLVS